jgi:predicted dehydrogenase
MLEFGIIGAENSHCVSIAKLCNVDKLIDARVTHVWGETPEFAAKAAAGGQIPNVVTDWKEMLGKVAGVMIDHRHAKPHYEVAKFFVSKGVPCFVDKPFTFSLKEAKALSSLARRKKVAITSFSVVPEQEHFHSNVAKIRAELGQLSHFISTGPVQFKSPYGGIFFYGIHQVDAAIEAVGSDVLKVMCKPNVKGGAAVLLFDNDVTVTMNFVENGHHGFHFAACGSTGYHAWSHQADQPSPYLRGAKTFTEMFRTGVEPIPHKRFIITIAVLEAMAKSLKTGAWVKVAKV